MVPPLGAPCPFGGEAEEPVAGQRESPGRKERSGERAPEDEEGRPRLSEPGPPVTPTSRAAPYDRMVEGYEQICYSIAAQCLIDFVPATEPGWDSRPRHGEEVLVKTGQIPTAA